MGDVLGAELRSCVKVEVAVPYKTTVSVDVKQKFNQTFGAAL